MSKKDIINRLKNTAKLETREDVLHFDEALERLAEIELSNLDIVELMMILDDDSPQEEVLFGLVHFLEGSVDFKTLIQALMKGTQKLVKKAPDWTQLFYIRLLKNQESRSILKAMLVNEESQNYNLILELIRDISLNELPPLSDYGNFVIRY
ncbi:MAG: Imm30 family immunity protein [Cyanobacteria bacterium J06632_19]